MKHAALLAALLGLAACREAQSPPASSPPPRLHLLTALPLLWGEEFGLDGPEMPAVDRLEKEFRLTPVDLPSQLPERGLLLAAQPRALPAEELVALDAWIRRGGRLLLLADPMLEWPSERGLGDRLRAPLAYADTGLLRHWGLRLDAPDERGPKAGQLGGAEILTASPGALLKTGGGCEVDRRGLTARCAIGKGRATIVADADFLNVGGEAGLDGPVDNNLDALMSELDSLSR